MANKKKIKPVTLRESIFEQEYRLKQQAKETLKKIKENGTTFRNKENSNS